MQRRVRALVLCASCLGLRTAQAEPSELPPVLGHNYGELETPRAAAVGGALRASSNSVSALQANPANMAASRIYHIGAFAQFWSQAGQHSYGAAVVDSTSSRSRLAGGLSAMWLSQDPDGVDRVGFDVRGALALPVSDRVLIGVAGHYLSLDQSGYPRARGALPPSLASAGRSSGRMLKELTVDVGLTVKPTEGFSIALVGNNLTDTGHSFLPLTLGGGVAYGSGLFGVEADLAYDFTTYEETRYRAMGGVELLAADRYPIRVGYRYEEGEGNHALSAGVGYLSREFSFDVSVRRWLGDVSSSVFLFGLQYHVEAGAFASTD